MAGGLFASAAWSNVAYYRKRRWLMAKVGEKDTVEVVEVRCTRVVDVQCAGEHGAGAMLSTSAMGRCCCSAGSGWWSTRSIAGEAAEG